MKSNRIKYAWWLLGAVVAINLAARDHAQQVPAGGHATGFTTDMYYEPPNAEQVQLKLSGAEALPDGAQLDIKNLQVQYYTSNGTMQVVARAPQCTYAPLDQVASSPGHLNLDSGDGRYHLEGDGFQFVFESTNSSLIISNNVHTSLATGMLNL